LGRSFFNCRGGEKEGALSFFKGREEKGKGEEEALLEKGGREERREDLSTPWKGKEEKK